MITRRATIAFVLIFLLLPFFQMAIPGQIRFDPAISLLIALIIYVDTERLALPILPAFVCALIGDLVHSQFVGVTALSMLLMCYFLFLIKDLIDAEQPMVDALVVILSVLIYHIFYWMVYALLGSPYTFAFMLRAELPAMIVETALTFIILFFMVRKRIQKRRDDFFK